MPHVDNQLSARALCVYAEPLVAGKRVLVVGNAMDDLGELLVDLGARLVHVYDADSARVAAAQASRGVSIHVLPEHDFDVRDGAFDLAIIPDLSSISDRAALLARLRRIVGREGAAIVASRNPSVVRIPADERSIDYYELYELVSLQFEAVRMIGQVPFSGVALVELGVEEEDADVTVDAQLAGEADPPEFFIALASQNDAELAKYAIVQLPRFDDVAPSVGARATLAESKLKADVLAAQLDDRSSHTRELEGRVVEAMAMADRVSAEATRAEERFAIDLQRHQEQIASLEEEIAARAARVAVLEGAFSAMEEAARDLERRAAAAERALEEQGERSTSLLLELDEARAAASAAAELNGAALSHEGEVAELEALLRNRGTHVAAIERELARREQIIHDLLSQLANGVHVVGAAPTAGPPQEPFAAPEPLPSREPAAHAPLENGDHALYEENVRLRAKLDALALDVARKEGEIATTHWRIAELEEQLSQVKNAGSRDPGPFGDLLAGETASLRADLDKARDELDMLRRALAQEHEAHLRDTPLSR